MKVDPRIPTRSLRPAPSQDAARGGSSFAQMLEGGTSAAQVVDSRALGFAEAGLMGLHFALGEAAVPPPPVQPAARPDAAAPAPPVQEAMATFTGNETYSAPPDAAHSGTTAAAPVGGRVPPRGAAPVAAPVRADAANLPVTGNDASEPHPPEEPALTGRIAAQIARLSSNPSPPRVRLREEASGVAVIIEGYVPDGATSSDLEQLVRATVAEFGMTASGVLVTPTRGIGNNLKRGN